MNKKSIFTIMVMEKIECDPITKLPEFGCERVMGWYEKFEDAYAAVSTNMCDINETCYDYALIEEIREGLYHPTQNRWWFQYNKSLDQYSQIEQPDFCKGYSGFTIG